MARLSAIGQKTVDDLYRNWVETVPDAARAYIQAEVDDEMADIARQIRTVAPEDEGDLKRSIKVVHAGWAPDNANVRGVTAGRLKEGDIGAAIVAGDKKAWYAALVEYGTRRMRAIPFFWPVWRARKKRLQQRIQKAWAAVFKSGAAQRPTIH